MLLAWMLPELTVLIRYMCMCVRQFIRELDPVGQSVCNLAVHPLES
jgi:hypothetical protein